MAKARGNTFSKMTPEQLKEISKKGGIASGESKRKKKAAKEILEVFMTMPLKAGKVADVESIKSFMDLKGKNITVQEAVQLQLIQKALKGDMAAMQLLLTLTGDKVDKSEIKAEVTKNPMADLTTEELRKLIDQNDTTDQ